VNGYWEKVEGAHQAGKSAAPKTLSPTLPKSPSKWQLINRFFRPQFAVQLAHKDLFLGDPTGERRTHFSLGMPVPDSQST
jgi:hypothetical protein